jgi:endonuclease/exonuclease/phosphatase family metal-dependent hydrolase
MSFNIRTAKSDENDPANNWDNRKEWVLKFINKCGADIIGMQEVKIEQYEYISQGLNSNYTMLNFPRQTGSNAEGLSMIYDNTKFELVSSERYWLSETPEEMSYGWGEGYYRIAVVLVLKHIETGELVKAIDTHGPLDTIANTNGYQLIMDRSVNEGDPFTFLCGDFNAGPVTVKPGYHIVAEELQDCRITALESSSRNDSTYTGFESYTPGQNGVGSIIDHCFVSNGDHVKVLTYEVCFDTHGDNNNRYWLSDHFPVYTTVEISYKTNIPAPGQTDGGFDGELDPAK